MILPQHWRLGSVGELIDGIDSGKNLRCEERPPNLGEVGIVKISAVTWGAFDATKSKTIVSGTKLSDSTRIKGGDLLISRANTLELVGASVIVDESPADLHLSDKVLRLRVKPGWEKWLNIFLNSANGRREIESRATGNQLSMRNISQDAIRDIALPIPPLAEQCRIVARIDALLARIRRTRADLERIVPLARRYQERLLEKAFSGDLSDEWRSTRKHRTTTTLILSGIREGRRPDPRLGRRATARCIPDAPIPETWAWISPDEVAEDSRYAIGIGPFGSNLVRSDYREDGVRLVFVRDIMRGSFNDAKARFITPEKAEELHQHVVRGGDVLITKMGEPPGDTTLFPKNMAPAVITADCIKLTPHHNLARSEFLTLCIRSPLVRRQIEEITKGVAQQKVSLENFRQIALPIPPVDEQDEIIARITAQSALIDSVSHDAIRTLALLDRLEQSFIARAFRGELVPQESVDALVAVAFERTQSSLPDHKTNPKRRRLEQIQHTGSIPKEPRKLMLKSRTDADVKDKPYLANCLLQVGSALSAGDLYHTSNLPIGDFYKQLSDEMKANWIKDVGGKLEAA